MTLYRLPEKLEWVHNVFDDSYTAQILFGELCVEPFHERRWQFSLYVSSGERSRCLYIGAIEDDIETLDEAQQAAETFYRERLAAGLVEATPQEIADIALSLPVEAYTMPMAAYLGPPTCDGHITSQRSFENRADQQRPDRGGMRDEEDCHPRSRVLRRVRNRDQLYVSLHEMRSDLLL